MAIVYIKMFVETITSYEINGFIFHLVEPFTLTNGKYMPKKFTSCYHCCLSDFCIKTKEERYEIKICKEYKEKEL